MVVKKKEDLQTKDEVVNVEEKDQETKNEESKNTQKEKSRQRKKLDPHEEVLVISRTKGALVYYCKRSNQTYKWDDYGDEVYVVLGDLQQMNKKFFKNGYLEIQDEDATEFLRAERFKENIITEDIIEELLSSDGEQVKNYLSNTSSNNKIVFYESAKESFVNGELKDYSIIQAIEDVIGKSVDPNKK